MGDAVFSHNVVHHGPGDGDDRAFRKHRQDAGDPISSYQTGGGQHRDRSAAGGIVGGYGKRGLPAHAGPDLRADSLRCDLAGKVHMKSVVYGYQVVLLGEVAHVVYIPELIEFIHRVAIDHR